MSSLQETAPPFVAIAHRIVWATVSTVDTSNRPRSRILHPIWDWNGEALVGWIATGPTPVKVANLAHSPFASVTYWDPNHDTVTAECRAELIMDDAIRTAVWARFSAAPEPLGYVPNSIPGWDSPTSPMFAVMRLDPWRLRVFPGSMLTGGGGQLLEWRA